MIEGKYFIRTVAMFEELSERPHRAADYNTRWSRYWYEEDVKGPFIIRESRRWSVALRSETECQEFIEHPDTYSVIGSRIWSIFVPQKMYEKVKKKDVLRVHYNTENKRLTFSLKNGFSQQRYNVSPYDMKTYYKMLREGATVSAANDYVVDMVNEKYSIKPLPERLIGKAYLEDLKKI